MQQKVTSGTPAAQPVRIYSAVCMSAVSSGDVKSGLFVLAGLLAFDLAAEAGFLNPDLSRRIAMLYQILDSDSKGSLRYDDMVESLRKIPRYEAMHLSTEDFQNLTDNYRLQRASVCLSSLCRSVRSRYEKPGTDLRLCYAKPGTDAGSVPPRFCDENGGLSLDNFDQVPRKKKLEKKSCLVRVVLGI
eukprot:557528-Rhodomonas_salina.4